MNKPTENWKIGYVSEHAEQCALFDIAWMHAGRMPELRFMFAIPNGGHRHPVVAGQMKAEGVRAGVPDIFLPAARGDKHGLFIEMKVGRNKPSSEQKIWMKELADQGYQVALCYSHREAWDVIVSYLGVKR